MAKNRKKIVTTVCILSGLFLLAFGYASYAYFKQLIITKASAKASSVIGLDVEIGDIAFGIKTGLNFHNISIKNPPGFDSGELLKIKSLHFMMNVSELLKGKVYFNRIVADSPELNILKDRDLGLNVSDTYRRLLSRQSAFEYQVAELKIVSGSFNYQKNVYYRGSDINLTLSGLSSAPGVKSFIKGTINSIGGNRIVLDGWANLSGSREKFDLSFFIETVDLTAFKGKLVKYLVDMEKTKIAISFKAERYRESGIDLILKIQAVDATFLHVKKGLKDIQLDAHAVYNLEDGSIRLDGVFLTADSIPAVQLKGVINQRDQNPFYSAEVKINRFDLASLDLFKDISLSGVMISDKISMKGRFDRLLPEIFGFVQFKDAAVKSKDVDIKSIQASVEFSSNSEKYLKAEASAKVLKAGAFLPGKPVDIKLSKTTIKTKGELEPILFSSSIDFFSIEYFITRDKEATLNKLKIEMDGSIKNQAVASKTLLDLTDLSYGEYRVNSLKSSFRLDYRSNTATVTNLKLETEVLRSAAALVKVQPETKSAWAVEIKELNMDYPAKQAEIKQLDLYFNLRTTKTFEGDFNFSLRKAIYENLPSGAIAGKGWFDSKEFSVTIPRAGISKGTVGFTARGKISKDPLPVFLDLTGQDFDLDSISHLVSSFFKIPYKLTGNLRKVVFQGSIESATSLQGEALIEGEKISLLKTENKSAVVKNSYIKTEIAFKGQDLDFTAEIGDKSLQLNSSGSIKSFMGTGTSAEIEATLPEIELNALRDSLWDVFPEKLLYADLQGYLSAVLLISYNGGGIKISGNSKLKNIIIREEYGEYSIGPINGLLPLSYGQGQDEKKAWDIPMLDQAGFSRYVQDYAQEPLEDGYSLITIASVSYGIPLLENMNIWIKPKGSTWNIGRFNAHIFGGRLYGSAVIDMTKNVSYSAAFLLDSLSLTKLCESIEPIKGYISGIVNGVANIKGTGDDISLLVGKADFWSYSAENEKRKISRELIRKLGGPSIKMYVGDRSFDKGIMSLHFQNGFVNFKELEISNRNFFGITDLSVKVAPTSNRIAIPQLMWTLREASERAAAKQ